MLNEFYKSLRAGVHNHGVMEKASLDRQLSSQGRSELYFHKDFMFTGSLIC
jgi:hypothetical protein